MRIARNPDRKPPSVKASPLTIRFVSLTLVFITIIALGAVAYFTERGIVVSRDWIIHTYQVRSQLSDLQLELTRTEVGETTDILRPGKQQLLQFRERSELAFQTLDELRRLTADNPGQRQRLYQLGQLLKENVSRVESRQDSARTRTQISPRQPRQQNNIDARNQQITAIVKSMQDEEDTQLERSLKAWDRVFRRNVFMLGLAFTVVTLMLAYHFRTLLSEVALTQDTEKQSRANADSYRLMSARILELQDAERRRIARELHDSVGQYLAGLKISLSQIDGGPRIENCRLILETIELTDYALQEVRTISHLLHPPLLEDLGFLPAARWYVDEFGKRSQVKVSLLIVEPIERLPREIEIALFRVLQEALTNVYRHAAAQSVHVRICSRDGHVTLTVADDGRGIPPEILALFRAGAAPGIGLGGMRERLAEFGGEIRVDSSSGGSVVEAVIPLGTRVSKEPLQDPIGIGALGNN